VSLVTREEALAARLLVLEATLAVMEEIWLWMELAASPVAVARLLEREAAADAAEDCAAEIWELTEVM
jgi:hypothetical protein